MEEIKNTEIQEEEVELTHSDKLLGIFTNPAGITKQMSKFPAKIIDWVLPLLLLIFITIAIDIIFVSVPKLRQLSIDQQMEAVQEALDRAVEQGQLTQEQADQRLEMTYQFMEQGIQKQLFFIELFKIIGILVGFLIITGLLFAVGKLVFQSEGTYLATLSSYGLPIYILILQVIIFLIVALITNKFFNQLNLSEYVKADPQSLLGFIVQMINLFQIWFLIIVGITFKNLMKLKSYLASIIATFIVYLAFCVIFYYLLQILVSMFFSAR